MKDGVDLIKGQPQLYLVFIPCKDRAYIPLVKSNQFPVRPTVILKGQVEGRLIVGDCHKRLDSIFQAFIKQIIIKLQSFFVGRFLIALWKNPAPRNGGAEHPKSHLGKQLNILFITMVEINPHQLPI